MCALLIIINNCNILPNKPDHNNKNSLWFAIQGSNEIIADYYLKNYNWQRQELVEAVDACKDLMDFLEKNYEHKKNGLQLNSDEKSSRFSMKLNACSKHMKTVNF